MSQEQPTSTLPAPKTELIFVYDGLGGCESHCLVQIFPVGEQTVVVVSEEADNPGTSITNAADRIATSIARQFKLNPECSVWIEHYGPDSYAATLPRRDDTYDQVTFTWRKGGATGPKWKRLTSEELAAVFAAGAVLP